MVLAPHKNVVSRAPVESRERSRKERRRQPRVPKQKTNSGAKKRFKVSGAGQAPAPPCDEEPQSREEVGQAPPCVQARPSGRRAGRTPGAPAARPVGAGGRRSHGTRQAIGARAQEAPQGARSGQGLLRPGPRSHRKAREQLLKSENYAYRDRKARKRVFRRLWILRINAAARRRACRTTSSWPAAARRRSTSTARSSPTSRSATPLRSRLSPSGPRPR